MSLVLNAVSHGYGKTHIFENFSATFETGVTLLTGESGAGKSTLLKLCATAEKPRKGTLTWKAEPVGRNLRRFRKVLGYAPQSVELPIDLTADEFLQHMAVLKGLNSKSRAQIDALLDQIGLLHAKEQRIIGFSGGMRRRLILCQALLGKPEVLALDEPTAELDEATAKRVTDLISLIGQRAVIVMTTHLPDVLLSDGARQIAISKDGTKSA